MDHKELETCCKEVLVWESCSQPWADHKLEEASCRACGKKFIKKGVNLYTRERSEVYFICSRCGFMITNTRIAHPVHDGPFPFSGTGRCFHEEVPFCPQCEKKPSSPGSLIRGKDLLL